MNQGEATILVSGKTKHYSGRIGHCKERTGMHRLLKLIRLLKGWDYSVVWDFSGEHATVRVKWPDDPNRCAVREA